MIRNVLAWVLIVLSVLGLILGLSGITAIWVYREPATREALDRMGQVENELRLGQAALGTAREELERSLSILDSTEAALNQFTQNDPEAFFEDVQTTLNDELRPELETARERLINARDTLENVRVVVFGLNIVPFIQVNIPDQTLTDLIDSADSLESRIGEIGDLAEQASKLLDDASALFGGDLAGTRESLEGFLAQVTTYEEKLSGWRDQVAEVREALPAWIDYTSILLTIILLWFGLSQVGLVLHGRALLRGGTPWEGWGRRG
jgi:DNA repair exonuclease SbcCD ATPase subunit